MKENPIRRVWILAPLALASLGLTPAPSSAEVVVEEQFVYDAGNIDLRDGGIGFDGAWNSSISHGRTYQTGITDFSNGLNPDLNDDAGLFFSRVPVAGSALSRFGSAGRAQAHRLISTGSQAALLGDNTTMWFSVLFAGSNGGYKHGTFLFGTHELSTESSPKLGDSSGGFTPVNGDGFGFTLQAAPDGSVQGTGSINALAFDNSSTPTVVEGTFTPLPGVTHQETSLIVGKINWKAVGTPDELFLFNVTDLSEEPLEGEAIASITDMDFDQSAFDTVAMWDSNNSIFDEIRFGTTFPSAIGLSRCPTGLSAVAVAGNVTLAWLTGQHTPASVQVLRNGVAIEAAASSPYTDTTADPGQLDYEVVFSMPGGVEACGSLAATYDGCITDLALRRSEAGMVLTWTNNLTYRGIQVSRNGSPVASLAGDAITYTDTDHPDGVVSYTVVPTTGTCDGIQVVLAPSFVRGDSNADGEVDISDAVFTLVYLFKAGASPVCEDAADANDDSVIDVADPLACLFGLFEPAFTIPAPYPECGEDSTTDQLDCITSCGPFEGTIDAVFFAQTHVHQSDHALFKLVSNREALIKAHVISPTQERAPQVKAILSLDGQSLELPLVGPDVLPTSIASEPGLVQHSFDDSFTGFLPKEWVQPGLSVAVEAADVRAEIDDLEIGAPTKVVMTMFDVHYFAFSPGDYPAGWKEELEAKWPVAELEIRRVPNVVFSELVIPPRGGVRAARVTSKDDYRAQTGISFDGEQAAALQWKSALKAAAGTAGRVSLYYVNIYGVPAGGQAGGFGGVGNGRSEGILHHELGHALSLPHWGNSGSYPYRGDMYGIAAPSSEVHVGPTWAFDLPGRAFIPPTVQPNSVGGTVGTFKKDPMQGGGRGDQEIGYLLRHFSDYSVHRMQNYLEGHVVLWNEELGSYARWDERSRDYTSEVTNNGVSFPVERDVEVVTVMAAVSGPTPEANLVYSPIGPYVAGLIELFDPSDAADRARAAEVFCPSGGCDVSLAIIQGGLVKTYMLPVSLDTSADPLSAGSLKTRALNLPARDGEVTSVDLLSTPSAERNGLPAEPEVLSSWNR